VRLRDIGAVLVELRTSWPARCERAESD